MAAPINFSWSGNKPAVVLTIALLAQAALVYGFARAEITPEHKPLRTVSRQFGDWTMQQENEIDKETQEVLKADDTLSRTYVNSATGGGAHLFVAFFRTQRTGQAPHSPKNCLPGSGWVPSVSDAVEVSVPGRSPLKVNRYVVQKGEAKSLVLYWYQSRDRVVASEYEAKFYVVADALRYNRTDTALVRVIIPMSRGESQADSEKTAQEFIRAFYAPLRQHFPA